MAWREEGIEGGEDMDGGWREKGETIHIGRWTRKWKGWKEHKIGLKKDGRERKGDEGNLGKERMRKALGRYKIERRKRKERGWREPEGGWRRDWIERRGSLGGWLKNRKEGGGREHEGEWRRDGREKKEDEGSLLEDGGEMEEKAKEGWKETWERMEERKK